MLKSTNKLYAGGRHDMPRPSPRADEFASNKRKRSTKVLCSSRIKILFIPITSIKQFFTQHH